MADFSGVKLEDLGWDAAWQAAWDSLAAPGWTPARLIRDNKICFGALMAGAEECEAVLAGRLWHEAETDAELPAVGDWVALELGGEGGENVVRARLPRRTVFSRKVPGESVEEQVLVANPDWVAVITDAGTDFNERRMERFFAVIRKGGARPLVVINKCDLFDEGELAGAAAAVRALDPGVVVHVVSAKRRKGLRPLRDLLKAGVTIAFAGSSGVGKSLLVNRLLGEDWQETGSVNEVTGRGRHTTTARELLLLERGGMLVDNPGIREVQMWTDERTLRESFADVTELAVLCRFPDCSHGADHGCAIRAAVECGRLDAARHTAFLRLEEEIKDLKERGRKRQMTLERRARRDLRAVFRNRADREEGRGPRGKNRHWQR